MTMMMKWTNDVSVSTHFMVWKVFYVLTLSCKTNENLIKKMVQDLKMQPNPNTCLSDCLASPNTSWVLR